MGEPATLKLSGSLSLPLDVVTEATAIVATRGAGKSSTSAVIVEEAFHGGVQCAVLDRTGVYWGLRSNAKGTGPGLGIYVLGGPHGDVPLEVHAGTLIADLIVDSGHSFVLDLSDFSKSAAIRFSADLLERLYDRKARARTTTLLAIDEAHFYAPQAPRGGFKGDAARLMGAMEDVVGLGRSRGLGVVLTTQRTQSLNKAVLDLIETMFVMRMLSPRAREAVRLWIQEKHEEDELGVIASLDALPTGTAWVWSPLRGILQRDAIRRIRTFDSYATPKPGETRAEPTVRAELDLAALGEEMRSTAERAKENDPGELRKRLAASEKLARDQAETIDRMASVELEDIFPRDAILSDYRAVLAAAQTAKAEIEAVLDRAITDIDAAVDRGVVHISGREPAPERPSPSGPRQADDRLGASPPEPALASAGTESASRPEDNGSVPYPLGAGARHLLDTLAAHHPVRLTVGQLSLLARRKARGGAWNTSMKQLRNGYILDFAGGLIGLSEYGVDVTGASEHRHVGPEQWREALPAAARDVFDYLVARYPDAHDTDVIAADLGKASRGGSWNTAIATLLRNDLARRDGGKLAATPEAVGL